MSHSPTRLQYIADAGWQGEVPVVLPKSRHAIRHTNSHANPDPLPSHGKHKIKNKQRTCVPTTVVRGPHEHAAWAHEMTKMASRIPGPATGHNDKIPGPR